MTIKEIKDRVNRIRETSGDEEIAHKMEDQLRSDFIDYVAHVADGDLAEKARLVSTTSDIRFPRYCA